MTSNLETARALLRSASRIAVLTGAGVSAESGVPTFRGSGEDAGFWGQRRVEDLATPEGFARDPGFVWQWYEERRRQLSTIRPNAGHYALVEMEKRATQFTLITQNVDGLHELAGSRNVVNLHGDIWMVRCTACGRETLDRTEHAELPPRCASCGALLRPGVVWFGESLPPGALEAATEAVRDAGVLLVVGTSAQVYPAAGLIPLALQDGASVLEINPESTDYSTAVTLALHGPSALILPQLL